MIPTALSNSTLSYEYLSLITSLQNTEPQSELNEIEIKNIPSLYDGLKLLLNDEFYDAFFNIESMIGISLNINEELKPLDDFQLDEISEKFSFTDRAILIYFTSNVDHQFFVRWRGQKRKKMFTLEILNNHSKDLFVVGEFIKDFLIDSLKSGEAGKSYI